MSEKKYQTLKDFYPYYLTEHSDSTCRTLHYIGTSGFLVLLATALFTQNWKLFIFMPLMGYGFAWVGHFFFEKNRPATFIYPIYSFVSDFIMCYHFFTGQIDKKLEAAKKIIASEVN
jgi:hypothetical protein